MKSKNLNINEMCAEILKNNLEIEQLKISLDTSVSKNSEHERTIADERDKVSRQSETINLLQVTY